MIPKSNRKLYLDFIRILAAFLVIYNHTDGYHFYLEYRSAPMKVFCTIMASSLTRVNVPLFAMISGVLLLGKAESYRDLFSKRILRFASVLFIFSITLYITGHIGDFELTRALKRVLNCDVTGVYWFLFSYLGFLFCLPFLRKCASQISSQDIAVLIICRTVLVSCPTVISYLFKFFGWEYLSISGNFSHIFATSTFLYYPLIGYYLDKHVTADQIRKSLPLLILILFADTLLSSAITYQCYIVKTLTQSYLGIFCHLSAISVFLIVKYLFELWQAKPHKQIGEKLLVTISSFSLGIYLIDPFLKDCLHLLQKMDEFFNGTIHIVPLSVLYCFVSMAIGIAITWVLRKLPVFRKLL